MVSMCRGKQNRIGASLIVLPPSYMREVIRPIKAFDIGRSSNSKKSANAVYLRGCKNSAKYWLTILKLMPKSRKILFISP